MITTIHALSHVGIVRSANEDRVFLSSLLSHGSSDKSASMTLAGPESCRFGVVDGMGGHVGGAVASDIVCRSIIDANEVDLSEALRAANMSLYQRMATSTELTAMGAAAVICAVGDGIAHIANVGDARAYHLSGGYLMLVSQDDRLSDSSNVLTQSLGGTASQAPVSPHVLELDIEPGDRLLLCSDGLSEVVSFQQLELCLLRDPSAAIQTLLSAALQAGAPDNVSIAVAAFSESPELKTTGILDSETT